MDEMATERIMTRSATRKHLEENRRITRSASKQHREGHRQNVECVKKNKKRPQFSKKSSSSGKSKAPKFKFCKPIFIKPPKNYNPNAPHLQSIKTVFKFRPAIILFLEEIPVPPELAARFQANNYKDDNPVATPENKQVHGLSKPLHAEGQNGEEDSATPCEGGDNAPGIKGEDDLDVGNNAAPSSEGDVSGGDAAPQI